MKSIVKQRDSWLYRYLTKDFILFGIDAVNGRREYYLETTCDIRKALINQTFKRIVSCILLTIIPSIFLYVMVVAPVIFIASWMQTGIFPVDFNNSVDAFTVAGAIFYALILFAFFMESPYGLEKVKESTPAKVIKQAYLIVKDRVCSKVEWK